MSKKMIKDTLSLLMITLVAAVCLSFVYELTKQPIQDAEEKEKIESFKKVFDSAEEFVPIDMKTVEIPDGIPSGVKINEALYAYENGKLAGYVLSVRSANGYGGDIVMSIGFLSDGTIKKAVITSSKETKGYGNIQKQIEGKKADAIEKNEDNELKDNEVDAISSATYTTNAMIDCINGGLLFVRQAINSSTEVR